MIDGIGGDKIQHCISFCHLQLWLHEMRRMRLIPAVQRPKKA